MLWPVLGGDDGLSPTASPAPPATGAVPPAKGVNKLAPLLLCAPCKPSGHRKCQSSTQWYVQQVKKQDGWLYPPIYEMCGLRFIDDSHARFFLKEQVNADERLWDDNVSIAIKSSRSCMCSRDFICSVYWFMSAFVVVSVLHVIIRCISYRVYRV